MFNKNNFCHVASNNRNEKKAGIFVYKTTDDLATVAVSGYFNEKIIDINLHDLIIHEWHDPADRTNVQRNVLCVIERTLDNVGTIVIKSKWQGDIEQDIEDLQEYVDNTFVRKDGTSVMTGPLLMRATDESQCAIAPYWDGVGFFKLNDDNSVTPMASLDFGEGFTPAEPNIYDLGKPQKKWRNLFLSSGLYVSKINNGANIMVPTTSGTMALTSDIKNAVLTITRNGTSVGTFSANSDTNTTIEITVPDSSSFVTLTTTQTITGTKTFAGSAVFNSFANFNGTNTFYGSVTIQNNGAGVVGKSNTDLSNADGMLHAISARDSVRQYSRQDFFRRGTTGNSEWWIYTYNASGTPAYFGISINDANVQKCNATNGIIYSILHWGTPNYAAAFAISSGYTALTNGEWLVAYGDNGAGGIYVNGTQVAQGDWINQSWSGNTNCQITLKAGDVVTFNYTGTPPTVKVIPAILGN